MRKKIIIGNWKMNHTISETSKYIKEFNKLLKNENLKLDFGIAAPFVCLPEAKQTIKDLKSKMILSAQDCHFEKAGAFTGCISYEQLKDMAIKYVIVGHSERRAMFNDTDEIVNKKLLALVNSKMIPILCVGEALEEREAKQQNKVVTNQLKKNLKGIDKEQMKSIIIAYEPVWAIGTGKSATMEDAVSMCKHIRKTIASIYDDETAKKVRIQYGGSVNDTNVKAYLSNEDIDGALVGGASLDASKFLKLLKEVY